jgi:hypothetical protein
MANIQYIAEFPAMENGKSLQPEFGFKKKNGMVQVNV